MTGHPTRGAPIDEVLDLIDKAIEAILTVLSALIGFGAGDFVLGVI